MNHSGHNMSSGHHDMHSGHNISSGHHDMHSGHNMSSGHHDMHGEHSGNSSGHGEHMATGHSMMGHSMEGMKFEWRLLGDTVLFDFWQIDQNSTLATSLFIIFLMGIFKEFLACWRRKRRQMRREEEAMQRYGRWHSIWHRLTDAGLYMTQVMVSYFLMLIAMTYNILLFMAVLLGLGFGYLLFMSGPDHGYGKSDNSVNKPCRSSSGENTEINGVVRCQATRPSPTSVMDVEDCCD